MWNKNCMYRAILWWCNFVINRRIARVGRAILWSQNCPDFSGNFVIFFCFFIFLCFCFYVFVGLSVVGKWLKKHVSLHFRSCVIHICVKHCAIQCKNKKKNKHLKISSNASFSIIFFLNNIYKSWTFYLSLLQALK